MILFRFLFITETIEELYPLVYNTFFKPIHSIGAIDTLKRIKRIITIMLSEDKFKSILEPIDGKIENDGDMRLGAVLIPYFVNSESILFIKRTETMKNHPGEIALPGGGYEPKDKKLINTVLREAFEEVGLKKVDINLLGRLPPIPTTSYFFVYPYVGFIKKEVELKIQESEVEYAFFVKLTDLLNKDKQKLIVREDGKKHLAYQVEGITIWGATATIIKEFLRRLQSK